MLTAHRPLWLLAPALLLLAACGSGGGTPPTLATAASLTGEVVEIDGQGALVAGVVLKLAETGEIAVTDTAGAFAFPAVPTGSLTLELVSCPTFATVYSMTGEDASNGEEGHQGPPWDEEEVEDGEDADEDDVNVHRVREQERVHLRLHIQDGAICEMECVRDQNRECEVEITLSPTEDTDDDEMAGKLEIESRDDRDRFKVYVWNATPDRDLEVFVVADDGDEESLGVVTVDADGEASWVLDGSEGDDLPFGVLAVADLEGYEVEVRDADTGLVLLTETIPAMPPYFGEHGQGSEGQNQSRAQDRAEDPEQQRAGDLDHDRDRDQEGDRTGYDGNAENAQGS